MRKSSLGRRSSTHIPVRVPSLGSSASRTCSGKKSTGTMLKPGFTQARRSQSADRESCGGYQAGLQRASTLSSMTPRTPRHTSLHGSLPTGSARPTKSQMQSMDSAKRMSSFGGGKRKDTRPIAEKSFQQAAQSKVQEYFYLYASDVIGHGNSIRPMNTKLFVDMMNHLLQNFESRIIITKSNYLEELPPLLRKLGYRSKVDRSWLMTVNTPHSWQHVVAVLSWLVDLKEIMDVTDPFEMVYPNAVEDQTEEEENDDEDAIKLDKDVVFHLKRSYQMQNSESDRLAALDREFLEKLIIDMKCTDEDIETVQRSIDLKKEELENELQRKNQICDEIQRLEEKEKAAIIDQESMQEYIEKAKTFVDSVEVKLGSIGKEITNKKAVVENKKKDLEKIKEKLQTQEISRDQINSINEEKNNLQRMRNYYENAIREYQNSAFNVDMKLAENQKKLEKLVLEYNKLLAEKVVRDPQLKNCEIILQLLPDISVLKGIDSNLKTLNKNYETQINELEEKKEKCESILKRANEDMEMTNEEIIKESALLERIEFDVEKQKELSTKEIEKLKERLNDYQKKAEKVSSELSQFDAVKLKEKKQALKMYEHDYQLLQKRSKEFLDDLMEFMKENMAEFTPVFKKFMKTLDKIEDLL